MVARNVLRFALIALLAGCGGGGMNSTPATNPVSATASTSAQFTITIPPKSASSTRAPKYVSPSTQSVTITLDSVNGTTYIGTAGSPASVTATLTPSSPNCAMNAGNLVCAVAATAVAGADIYSVTLYDGSNHVLSQGAVTMAIIAGAVNSGFLTLTGAVAAVTVAFATNAHVSGTQAVGFTILGNQPRTFTVTAQDADGNTIVGPGAPTFTVTSGNSAVAIATTATAGTYTAQVQSYSATPVHVTMTPSNGSAVAFNITPVQELWIGNSSANTVVGYNAASLTAIAGDTITGLNAPYMVQTGPNGDLWISNYSANSIEEVVPETNTAVLTIKGAATGIDGPFGIAFDSSGNLYLDNGGGNTLQKFAASSFAGLTGSQNIAPAASTTVNIGDPVQNAFDANGILWVAGDTLGGVSAYNSSLTNVALIEGPTTQLTAPTGVAFDTGGHLWVVDDLNDAAYEFNTAGLNLTNGDIAPSVTIAGSATGMNLPVGCTFDAAGNLWVANRNANSVTEYAAGSLAAGGNLAPVTTIRGLSVPGGVTFTP